MVVDMEHFDFRRALRAVSDPKRREILQLLKQKGCCSIAKPLGLCACDIEQRLPLSQPTISHHMNVLTKAGLVEREKHGQWAWYRRNEKTLRQFREAMESEI